MAVKQCDSFNDILKFEYIDQLNIKSINLYLVFELNQLRYVRYVFLLHKRK